MTDRLLQDETQTHDSKGLSRWQPIETAPMDFGSRLYLVGRFCVQGFIDVTGTLQAQTEISPHWRKMRGKPTHWMPLPPPPAAALHDGGNPR